MKVPLDFRMTAVKLYGEAHKEKATNPVADGARRDLDFQRGYSDEPQAARRLMPLQRMRFIVLTTL